MTARKIRMTAVGLIAMPADRDEALVTADDIPSDPALCTAFGELLRLHEAATDAVIGWADAHGTCEEKAAADDVAFEIESAWDEALDAAGEADVERLRGALKRARDVAHVHDLLTTHEDAALAMLPGDAS